MKREILFRGKTINGEWVYGNYAHIKKDFSIVKKGHYISNSVGSPFSFLVRPETVSQFTGSTDKNGVKIFEGDIINVPYNNIGNSVVKYLINELRYNISNYNLSKIDVIGNIHDA